MEYSSHTKIPGALRIYNHYMKSVLLTALLVLGFALVHSLLALPRVKQIATSIFGAVPVKAFYRLFYSLLSAILTLTAISLFLRIPDMPLFVPRGILLLSMLLMEIFGIAIGIFSFRDINFLEFIGIAQAIRYLRKEKVNGDIEGLRGGLVTSGIYGKIRHPLYLAGILIFTFQPYITRNMLVITALADMYFVYGALIEEKRLLKVFGEEYRNYMKKVPRFIPKSVSKPGGKFRD